MSKPTAIVYIDGLNLQRRLVERAPDVTWVDYVELSKILLPQFDIQMVRVFTSISASADPVYAKAFWKKLTDKHGNLEIYLGRISTVTRIYPVHPRAGEDSSKSATIKVRKLEEKGSDVALGSYMVFDAFTKTADLFALMSSDTDFEPTLKLLRDQLNLSIGVLCTTENLPKLFTRLEPNVVRYVRQSQILNSRLT
jgi:uncharacterized LabA/DUF88 family protein